MSENNVQGVGRVEYAAADWSQAQNVQTDQTARAQEAASAVRSTGKEKPAPQDQKSQAIVNNLSDVRLKFQVNPETNHVTVLVLDKSSKKVIRTIPAEDLSKFHEGELFELTT